MRHLINRKTVIGGAAVALLPTPARALAEEKKAPHGLLVVLLKGLYKPVHHAPNLGLSAVDLDDGSYSRTKIYPVLGLLGHKNGNRRFISRHRHNEHSADPRATVTRRTSRPRPPA